MQAKYTKENLIMMCLTRTKLCQRAASLYGYDLPCLLMNDIALDLFMRERSKKLGLERTSLEVEWTIRCTSVYFPYESIKAPKHYSKKIGKKNPKYIFHNAAFALHFL